MTKLDVLVDLQFGSTGKGLLSGHLSEKTEYGAAISNNMPNAGHTAYSSNSGKKFVHKVLPSGIFSRGMQIIGIGPGSVFFPDRLVQEWEGVCEERNDLLLVIHEAAAIAIPEDAEKERQSLSRIASTMQGSAEALIRKIRREPGAIAKHWSSSLEYRLNLHGKAIVVNQFVWLDMMGSLDRVLVEGSQGYSLGLSAGFYPNCTSRDCTVGRVLADCNLPVKWLNDVYGCARVHPIRVGNTLDGYSGDWYPDQRETTFEDLMVEPEKTTVTGRVRRVASFSYTQIREAMMMAHPTAVFLNFAQYDAVSTAEAHIAIDSVAKEIGCGTVKYLGMGPTSSDIIEFVRKS